MATIRTIPLGPREFLYVGAGGWVSYRGELQSDAEVWVRLEARGDRRLGITELHTYRVSAAGLRSIPLGRIETALNTEEIRPTLKDLILDEEAGAPLRLLRKMAPSEAELENQVLSDHEAWLADQVLGMEQILLLKPKPGVRGLDGFYREIGALYERLLSAKPQRGSSDPGQPHSTRLSPAAEIARRADVAESTVHRWIKEARRRGLMSPSRRAPRREPKRPLAPH